MIVEDHRYISCGGDPFNYLKSVMKGLYFQLDPGQDANILIEKEKFPYTEDIFNGMANASKLKITKYEEKNGEISIIVRKFES
jgi:TusA-related sulfurtransferase